MTIFIADDHTVVRQGIKMLLDAEPDFQVVGEASDGEDACRAIRQLRPDIAVIDVSMPGLNGAQTAERLRAACGGTRILALSAYGDDAHVRALVEAGAAGYLLKRAAADELADAIRAIAHGGRYFDATLTVPISVQEHGTPRHHEVSLSPREVEIVKMVVWGHSNKEIASYLYLSIKTVEGYKTKIMEKLGFSSRVELVRFAMKKGWMQDDV